MEEREFDKNVIYTLRIELLNGKILLYPIDTENKQYLIDRLREHSGGNEGQRLSFLWFEIPQNRIVIINAGSVARIVFCFDSAFSVADPYAYNDNFNVMLDDELEVPGSADKEGEPNTPEETYLPQAIVYHKGETPNDQYVSNPLTYDSLSEGCLNCLNIELQTGIEVRQFLNLIDNDGEETFIPMDQIIAAEFDSNLVYEEEESESTEEKGDE